MKNIKYLFVTALILCVSIHAEAQNAVVTIGNGRSFPAEFKISFEKGNGKRGLKSLIIEKDFDVRHMHQMTDDFRRSKIIGELKIVLGSLNIVLEDVLLTGYEVDIDSPNKQKEILSFDASKINYEYNRKKIQFDILAQERF